MLAADNAVKDIKESLEDKGFTLGLENLKGNAHQRYPVSVGADKTEIASIEFNGLSELPYINVDAGTSKHKVIIDKVVEITAGKHGGQFVKEKSGQVG